MTRLARLFAVAGLMASFGAIRPLLAHAFLERASPAVGAEIPASPPVLRLSFTEPV